MQEEPLETPRLGTKRLDLRPMTLDDIDFLLKHFGDPETNRYSSYEDLKTRKDAIQLYRDFMEPGSSTRFRLGVELKEIRQLVGTLGLHNYSRRDRRAEIGFDLYKDYWGKGIMTEAVRILINYGFQQLNLNRIEATTDSENTRSIRLLERLGFLKEGRLRQKYFYKGKYHDEIVFSLLKKDWEKK
jgi:ribosomal-protein-alanine N-acetyltransferase